MKPELTTEIVKLVLFGSETLGKLGFSGPKNDSEPDPTRVFGQVRVGSDFGRATQKFLASGRASVGKSVNFCPNVQP